MMRLHKRAPDERGAALILALTIVFVVGVMATAALSYTATSLSATNNVYGPGRVSHDDVDSAIRAAAAYVAADARGGGTVGRDLGRPCPPASGADPKATFVYPGASGNVTVLICPQPYSLDYTGKRRAVLVTLATSGQGITQTQNNALTINGDVWSNSYVSARNIGVTGGHLWAWNDPAGGGNCSTNKVSAAYGKDCNAHTTFGDIVPSIGKDPGWLPAASPGSFVTPTGCAMQPGVYVHGDDLTAACSGNVTLTSGEYYLDFPVDGTATSKSSTDDTWTINGTLTGPSCANESAAGAQIVLANASQISNGGTITLPCGARASLSDSRISIMSLQTAVAAGSDVTTTLRPTTAADAGGGFFPASGANAASNAAYSGNVHYPQDGTQARAVVSSNNKTAQLALGSFAASSGPALTSNSVITSLKVNVIHDESNSNISFTATKPKLVWGSCSIALSPLRSATPTPYTADITSGLSGCTFDPATSPTLTWIAKTTSSAAVNIDVDGAQLSATWHDAGIPAQTGCVLQGLCPAVRSAAANGHDSFAVEDVVYLPKSQFQTTCKNSCTFHIGGALIAWSAVLDSNPSANGTPIVGDSPNEVATGNVLFQASLGGAPRTDAVVAFDPSTKDPTIATWVNRS